MQPRLSQLAAQRRAIRRLLREHDPADAMAAYYAFHHPDDRPTLVLAPEGVEAGSIGQADGYVALSRTGIDLFLPHVVDSGGGLVRLENRLAPGHPEPPPDERF